NPKPGGGKCHRLGVIAARNDRRSAQPGKSIGITMLHQPRLTAKIPTYNYRQGCPTPHHRREPTAQKKVKSTPKKSQRKENDHEDHHFRPRGFVGSERRGCVGLRV